VEDVDLVAREKEAKSQKWSSKNLNFRIPHITGQREFSSSDSSPNPNDKLVEEVKKSLGQKILDKFKLFKKQPSAEVRENNELLTTIKSKPVSALSLQEKIKEGILKKNTGLNSIFQQKVVEEEESASHHSSAKLVEATVQTPTDIDIMREEKAEL